MPARHSKNKRAAIRRRRAAAVASLSGARAEQSAAAAASAASQPPQSLEGQHQASPVQPWKTLFQINERDWTKDNDCTHPSLANVANDMAMLRKDVEQNRIFQSAMFRQMEEENAELRRKIKVMEGTVEMAIPVENDLRAEIYNPKYQVETLLAK